MQVAVHPSAHLPHSSPIHQTKVGFWGGSCAIRLPKIAVERLGFHNGETVHLNIEKDALVIRPKRSTYKLDDLVDEAKKLTPPVAMDDPAQGDELL